MNYEEMKEIIIHNRQNAPTQLIEFRLNNLQMIDSLPAPKMTRFSFKDWQFMAEEDANFSQVKLMAEQGESDNLNVRIEREKISVELPVEKVEAGLVVADLLTAVKDDPTILDQYLMKSEEQVENKVVAYHAAFINSGLFIHVPQNMDLMINLNTDFTKSNNHFHLILLTEPDSNVEVVSHAHAAKNNHFAITAFVEIFAKENSKVLFSSFDELNQKRPSYYQYSAQAARNTTVNWALGLMNESDTVNKLSTHLIGAGSTSSSNVVTMTTGNQQMGIENRLINNAPHTQGTINQRGVAMNDSRLVLNGIGKIIHGAHGAHAEQENRLLMMSPGATGDANPILLIDENDVEAGHAASVGKIDQNQLYYLLSRGIPKHQAQRMVIRGFLSSVITTIPDDNIRQKMIDALEGKLKQNG